MAASNQQLGFAIRAVNEASRAMREIQDDLGEVDKKAIEASGSLGGVEESLYSVGEAGGNAEQALRGVSDITSFLGDKFGVSVGPLQEWTASLADVGGGIEGVLKGGPALVQQIGALPGSIAPAIAAAWSHVAALTAQAAAFIVANAPILLLVAGLALLAAGVFLVVKHWDTIVEKVPGLKTALDGSVSFITGTVVPAFTAIWEKGLKPVIDFVTNNWPLIGALILLPFAPLIILATDAFGIRSALVGAIQGIISFVTDSVSAMLSAGKALGGALKDGIVSGFKEIVGSVADIASALTSGLKAAVNQALAWAHDNIKIEIPGFDPPGAGSIPGFTWSFPLIQLAKGGIVTQPTIALIGEAGPEAVVPLSGPNAQGFGTNVTVVVQALDAGSVREWLRNGGAEIIADEVGRRVSFA